MHALSLRFGLAAGLCLTALQGAVAAPGTAKTCADPRGALGVARVVEIDTTTGPRFGHQQYPDVDFLGPKEVVLTFDDGPLRPYTRPVLDALEAECTRATFFMVGRMALSDPELVREVARRGHTVGTHTFSHANLRKAGPIVARQEIELGFSAVRLALGTQTAPFFRFPYLADPKATQNLLRGRRMGMFSIEVDAYDYKTKDPAEVHRNVLAQLDEKGRGIILFHDIQASTARALPGLLAALKARGYRVVHTTAKGKAQTLPEFDLQARHEAGQRHVATLNRPLVDRSLTWTMNTRVASAEPGAVDGSPRSAPVRRPPAPAAAADLPWLAPPPVARTPQPLPQGAVRQGLAAPPPVQGAPIPSAPVLAGPPLPITPEERAARAQARQRASDNDWRTRIFRN